VTTKGASRIWSCCGPPEEGREPVAKARAAIARMRPM
jgi:hypothetical protein